MRYVLLLISCLFLTSAKAQFAPQVGIAGNTAISATDAQIVGWATDCRIIRGLMDVANPSLGYVSAGDSSMAIGAADGSIVSLGDSGIAIITFAHPIYNGSGPDFAVFENGFKNPADATMAFLELAFVEVSSDGINYFRFPSTSNTPLNTQIPGSGVYMDATLINNFAGKYVSGYGTPFDLQELSGTAGLNINAITHIRLVDVIGSVNAHSSQDYSGHIINDPYPTDFPTGGFDLDAVGAIHQYAVAVNDITTPNSLHIFPNPATDQIHLSVSGSKISSLTATVSTPDGTLLQHTALSGQNTSISVAAYPAGLYFITLRDSFGNAWVEKVIKQ
jgi:hypothetical protein